MRFFHYALCKKYQLWTQLNPKDLSFFLNHVVEDLIVYAVVVLYVRNDHFNPAKNCLFWKAFFENSLRIKNEDIQLFRSQVLSSVSIFNILNYRFWSWHCKLQLHTRGISYGDMKELTCLRVIISKMNKYLRQS